MPTPDRLTLGLLPERKISWRTFVTSYAIQIVLVLLLLGVRLLWPERLQLERHEHITELIPLPMAEPEPPKMEAVEPVARPLPPPMRIASPKLVVPKDLTVQLKKPVEVAPPRIEADFKPPQLKAVATLPAKVVYTGSFGSSATTTVNAPIEKVQTGGFGDPEGLRGDGKENAHLASAKLGAFDLPQGSGNGNGVGGGKGQPGVVASAGFGNGIAQGVDREQKPVVQNAGFASQEMSHIPSKLQTNSGPLSTSVEIISKPNPVYTAEALQLKIEGEVLLEVLFGANGQLHVNNVVRGLGYGLDEAAVAAANKIQFKPATSNGGPVDSTSIVHVVFRLAY